YFAQNSDVYRILGQPVTPILHRKSFTIVEAKHRRTFEKFGLEFSDLFVGVDGVLHEVGAKQLPADTAAILEEIEYTIATQLDKLNENLLKIDPTLSEGLTKRRKK